LSKSRVGITLRRILVTRLTYTLDGDGEDGLRSSSTRRLVMTQTQMKRFDGHAVGVAAARVWKWNDLLPTVVNAPSVPIFKTYI